MLTHKLEKYISDVIANFKFSFDKSELFQVFKLNKNLQRFFSNAL